MTSDGYEAIIIDWAGTITVPLLDVVLHSARELEFSAGDMAKVMDGLAGYVNEPESIVRR